MKLALLLGGHRADQKNPADKVALITSVWRETSYAVTQNQLLARALNQQEKETQ